MHWKVCFWKKKKKSHSIHSGLERHYFQCMHYWLLIYCMYLITCVYFVIGIFQIRCEVQRKDTSEDIFVFVCVKEQFLFEMKCILKIVFRCKLSEQLTVVVVSRENKHHSKACDRTNEKLQAPGIPVNGVLQKQGNMPWKETEPGQIILHKNECNILHCAITFLHSDMQRVLLVHRLFLETSIWKIYLHYFASSKQMYFSDKYFFLFYFYICFWMNICLLYQDAFWYSVFLPIVACSSCFCHESYKCSCCFFGYLSMPLTVTFIMLHWMFYLKHHVSTAFLYESSVIWTQVIMCEKEMY